MQRPASFFECSAFFVQLLSTSKFKVSQLLRKALVTLPSLFLTSSRPISLCCFVVSMSGRSVETLKMEEKLVLAASVYVKLYDMSDKDILTEKGKPVCAFVLDMHPHPP